VQIKSLIIASVFLTSFMAAPLRVQAEDRVVPPTVGRSRLEIWA
jgi:hypothetical protein